MLELLSEFVMEYTPLTSYDNSCMRTLTRTYVVVGLFWPELFCEYRMSHKSVFHCVLQHLEKEYGAIIG